MNSEDGIVRISMDRLRQLEEIESNLPKKIENAIAEYKKSNLKRLHERDKADPKSVNLRVKRYVEKHKDEINAKRREKRKQKKLPELVESYQTKNTKEGSVKQVALADPGHVPSAISAPLAPSAPSASDENKDPSIPPTNDDTNKAKPGPKTNITVRVTRLKPPPLPVNLKDVTVRFDK